MLQALVMTLIVAVTPVWAEDWRPETVVEYVRAEDHAGLDAFLTKAHEAFTHGDLSADDMPCVVYRAVSQPSSDS